MLRKAAQAVFAHVASPSPSSIVLLVVAEMRDPALFSPPMFHWYSVVGTSVLAVSAQ
jgi:hypothetical protein